LLRKGFALGFRPKRFIPNENLDDLPPDRCYFTGTVRYDEAVIRALHRESIEHALDLILRTSSDPSFQEHPEFIRLIATEMLLDAVVTSLTSKPTRWAKEEERRLYYPVGKDHAHLYEVHSFNGRNYLHMKVAKDGLAEVAAATNTSAKDCDRIRRALDESGYAHVKITAPKS
jgi:hypothetical protein